MIKKSILRLGLFGVIGASVAGIAYAAPDGAVAPIRLAAADTVQTSTVSAVGVVQQTRPEQGKIKISHEAIPALDWPPMTMLFRVKDNSNWRRAPRDWKSHAWKRWPSEMDGANPLPGHRRKSLRRLGAEYEWLLTQRRGLQPRVELNA